MHDVSMLTVKKLPSLVSYYRDKNYAARYAKLPEYNIISIEI